STQDFPFVREGMERLKQAAPGLKRLLTKEPEPGLIGSVNLWCPILNAYDPQRAAAQQRSRDEVWWYICTGPKAPYPGEFIDRPATDMRAWVWDTWMDKVQGLLIWETTYWTSPTAYPDTAQDPWTDPMSWEQGYGAKPGARNPWGNGDGRFLYPPTAAERATGRPILHGPIDSLRWEMLRDGLEDYEYFRMLQDRITAARKRSVPASKLAATEALLQIPPSVLTGLTSYSADPRPMYAHRLRLAEAIEALK
ncbi:MAG TPA: DUF4091 domain-containing protein, partial [Armatimonadota bacterium]|nr:DUF4091 domain-containing protein [Armatimonadota bacterium]